MLTKYSRHLKKIFIGRKEELELLESIWEDVLEPEEHYVYVLLNAPGIGKTRLLKYFGENLEKRYLGLYFHYPCDSRHQTISSLNKTLLERFFRNVMAKRKYIITYINQISQAQEVKEKLEGFQKLLDHTNSILDHSKITLDETVTIIDHFSTYIPIFFVADEIQEFQGRIIVNDIDKESERQKKENETALHYFTRILKSLTWSNILIILSGTQYHILSQIGSKIGSPIAQKVKQVLIKNFTPQEVDQYVDAVTQEIVTPILKEKHISHGIDALLSYYRQFLQSFSGGHPRTIVFITEWFLAELETLTKRRDLNYQDFLNVLMPLIENDFKKRIFSHEKMLQIQELQASTFFPLVYHWIITHSHFGHFLGTPPTVDDPQQQEEINHLVYQLMTMGLIVQNGANQYYLTSYFHLLAFVDCFTEEYVLFLRKILHDRFFKLLCGGHAGFGYTFEHILIAALIVKGYQPSTSESKLPKNAKTQKLHEIVQMLRQIQSVELIHGDVNWKTIALKRNVLYHSPHAHLIDLFLFSDNNLLLIQMTTAVYPKKEKLYSFTRKINEIKEYHPNKKVTGWYISLFPVPLEKCDCTTDSLIISSNHDLEPILGDSLLKRLMEIKKELST